MKLNFLKVSIVLMMVLLCIFLVFNALARKGIFLGDSYCEFNGNHPPVMFDIDLVAGKKCDTCFKKMSFPTPERVNSLCEECAKKLSRCEKCGNKLK